MPGLTLDRSSSASSASTPLTTPDDERIVNDLDYAAISFPGYAEKPLSEQLEPIAVVGMGKSSHQYLR